MAKVESEMAWVTSVSVGGMGTIRTYFAITLSAAAFQKTWSSCAA